MKISVGTLFPALYEPFLQASLVKRAQQSGLVSYALYNMFQTVDPAERVDGPTYGHGPGMVIRPEVVERTVLALEASHGPAYKILFSPRGRRLNQTLLQDLVRKIESRGLNHIMLLPARYEGMDARIEQEYADDILSLGDFILMGGDLPAMVFMESFLRYIPGVVGKAESVEHDSFTGPFVDHPEYTMPAIWRDHEVPAVLRSGNHKAIASWQRAQAVHDTVRHHFDWLRSYNQLTDVDRQAAYQEIPPHYVALMHTDVLLPVQGGNPGDLVAGTTSVTSIDLHDIARSCATYGIAGYGIITPLQDQQNIVRTMLQFWKTGAGISYNPHRHYAVSRVEVMSSLSEWLEYIAAKEGKKPILVTTCARDYAHHAGLIDYHDQKKVWAADRPVVIIFGTGRGLTPELVQLADFHLVPLEGFTEFNHLSVRSAAAIVLDKWLGRDSRIHT
jgi:tRNA (guanine37-N1)-methyltransferase